MTTAGAEFLKKCSSLRFRRALFFNEGCVKTVPASQARLGKEQSFSSAVARRGRQVGKKNRT